MTSRTISLFAVDLAATVAAWEKSPLSRLAEGAPRGRVAALMAAPFTSGPLDGSRPPRRAAGALRPSDRRALFDALVEDMAAACVWEAPNAALTDALDALARLTGRADLAFPTLAATARPAYPADVDESGTEAAPALVVWRADPQAAARAAEVLRGAGQDAATSAIGQDVLDALAPVFVALARPGHSLVALGEWLDG